MKNKMLSAILLILICISVMPSMVFAYDTVYVYVNGKFLETDQPAIIYQDRTMVPLRAICEALGCDVEWYQDTQSIEVSNGLYIIGMQIGNYNISIRQRAKDWYAENPGALYSHDSTAYEDRIQPIDVPPMIINERTLVPARALSEALNAYVEYVPSEHCVYVESEYDYIGTFIKATAMTGASYPPLACVCKNGMWGFINIAGEIQIPLEYDWASDFSSGHYFLAVVKKNGMYTYIQRDGICVPYNFVYEDAYPYGEYDVTLVKMNGKWGFGGVNQIPNYKNHMNFIYDDAKPFSDGRAAVKKNRKWGYIDTSGKEVLSFAYDNATSFFGGTAIVQKSNSIYVIDLNGNKVNVESMHDGNCWSYYANDIWLMDYESEKEIKFTEYVRKNFNDVKQWFFE